MCEKIHEIVKDKRVHFYVFASERSLVCVCVSVCACVFCIRHSIQ